MKEDIGGIMSISQWMPRIVGSHHKLGERHRLDSSPEPLEGCPSLLSIYIFLYLANYFIRRNWLFLKDIELN